MNSIRLAGSATGIPTEGSIVKITIEQPQQRGTAFPSCNVRVRVSAGTRNYEIRLGGVVQMSLGEIGPAGLQWGEIYVQDLSDAGWEAAKYKFGDELDGWFFYCRKIEVDELPRPS